MNLPDLLQLQQLTEVETDQDPRVLRALLDVLKDGHQIVTVRIQGPLGLRPLFDQVVAAAATDATRDGFQVDADEAADIAELTVQAHLRVPDDYLLLLDATVENLEAAAAAPERLAAVLDDLAP